MSWIESPSIVPFIILSAAPPTTVPAMTFPVAAVIPPVIAPPIIEEITWLAVIFSPDNRLVPTLITVLATIPTAAPHTMCQNSPLGS